LECSRPGASAVALWATQKLLPLTLGGTFAAGLEACREAALSFTERLSADSRWVVPFPPELDIVVWAPQAPSVQLVSERTQRLFDAAARRGLHLALIRLPRQYFPTLREPPGQTADAALRTANPANPETVLCLRSVLMKPEHREWLDQIWAILNAAWEEVS